MIANAFILIFPLLAAVPFIAVFLLLRLPSQEKEPAWRRVAFFAAPFALWQFILNLFLYSSSEWMLWSRLVDPVFLAGILSGVLLAESSIHEIKDNRHQQFLLQVLPWLLLNAVAQVSSMLIEDLSALVSFLGVILLGYRMIILYGKFTIRPRIRQRISVLMWILTSLMPLPFFRLFFLLHIAVIWWNRLLHHQAILREETHAQENEKKVISQISETLTTVIQDVSNLQDALFNYLEGLCKSLEVKSGAVYLWDSEAKAYRVAQVYGLFFPLTRGVNHTFMRERALHELVRSQDVTDSDNLIWECGQLRKPIHLPYASQDPRVQKIGTRGNNIHTLVLVPLLLDQELLGVLVLENKHYERYFSESDAYLVYTFAHYATLMINSSRMLKDRADRERVQNELKLGQQIQYDLLPRKIPAVDGIELAGSMIPAKEIGGDYYDFIEVSKTRFGIAIGDVSGKGVPAGMLMTILQTLLHSQYAHFNNTCDLLIALNTALSYKIKSSMFITFLLFEWNAPSKTLKYTGCGHEHILHYHAATSHLDCFRSGGIALGMTDDNSAILRERQLPVAVGDTVLLYTDGVIEARNIIGEMYGLDRLKAFTEKHQGLPAENVRKALMETLDVFQRGTEQVDDITCIVMRF